MCVVFFVVRKEKKKKKKGGIRDEGVAHEKLTWAEDCEECDCRLFVDKKIMKRL